MSSSRKNKKGGIKKRREPGLPNVLRKEIGLLTPKIRREDDEIDSDEADDLYEYEEGIPEEESRKNRRFDPIESYEYELPENFKDEYVASDDDDDDENDHNHEDDDGRHSRMLQQITGLPGDAFEGKQRKKDTVISESYPESEFNPTRDTLGSGGRITMEDLLAPLHEKPEFSKIRKNIQRMERKSMAISAPLPKPDQERLERKATYELSKKDITKWEPLVKRNREAPTIYFDEDVDLGFSTVGAMAAGFEPRTDFEKKIATLVNSNEVVEAHRQDGAKLLEMNEISIEDEMDRQNRLAKMRSLLFRHELKAKRIKKIKSKTYHRLLKKDRLKAVADTEEMDPEAAKELEMKQEFKRAEERMTLKHKNSSKWAKRILKRGLSVQDEGTRAAIAEQLHQHTILARKMNSMRESSSSDDSSDEDGFDDASAGSEQDHTSKLLEKAKAKTLEVMAEDDELPKSGVLTLPFMVRGLKKRTETVKEEAKLALLDYESSLKQLEDENEVGERKKVVPSGKRVFGAPKKLAQESNDKFKIDTYYGDSDNEDDTKIMDDVDDLKDKGNLSVADVNVDPDLLRDESEIGHDTLFKSFEDIVKDPGPKTTYDVAIFASNSWKKLKNPSDDKQKKSESEKVEGSLKSVENAMHNQDEGEDDDSDTDGGGEMVDGILTSGSKLTYKLPSQEELIRRAFAGDDVEDEFEREKQDILNEENPEPEKPALIPGWGQWTHIQKKKGLPSWMLAEHESARKKREEALKKRKDAHLNHVIISEKLDKKAEKLHTKTLPFPYTSKEVFEQSMRMPIGPEFNPATVSGALNRPEVVKKSGVIIKPIKYEDVNPHEREDENQSGRKRKKGKANRGKATKRRNTKAIKA